MDLYSSPRIMVLGHSFVWRIAKFLAETSLPCVSTNFHLTTSPPVKFHGIGGRTVPKLRQFDLSAVADFGPTVIILDIGSNDLSNAITNVSDLAANIFQLVQLLHFTFSVHHIIVGQILPRKKSSRLSPPYNSRVFQLNCALSHLFKNVPFATFWFHNSIFRSLRSVFLSDGIHLNSLGNHLLYHSYQKALLRYFSSIARTRVNGRVSLFSRPPCHPRRPHSLVKPHDRFRRRCSHSLRF